MPKFRAVPISAEMIAFAKPRVARAVIEARGLGRQQAFVDEADEGGALVEKGVATPSRALLPRHIGLVWAEYNKGNDFETLEYSARDSGSTTYTAPMMMTALYTQLEGPDDEKVALGTPLSQRPILDASSTTMQNSERRNQRQRSIWRWPAKKRA